MNHIKNILHKYLCPDAIAVLALGEKAGDCVWLEKMGYYVRETGEETAKGRTYTKKHDEMMALHFGKIKDNSLEAANLNKLRSELREYIILNPKADIYSGLSEAEAFAFRNAYHGHW